MGWPLGIPGGAGCSESEVPGGGVAPGTVSPPARCPGRSRGLWVRSARRVRPSTVSPPGGPSGAKRPCSPGLPAGLVAVPLSSRGSGVPVTTSLLSDTHQQPRTCLYNRLDVWGALEWPHLPLSNPEPLPSGPASLRPPEKRPGEKRPMEATEAHGLGIRPGPSFFL